MGRSIAFDPTLLQDGLEYQLRAVVVHLGEASSGHYICYQRRGEQWWKCDDSSVTPCDWSTVLRDQAYVLFYSFF